MVATATNTAIQSLLIEKDVLIAAPIDIAFDALLEELGPAGEVPGNPPTPMPMVFEPWPGGRWFRDLGKNTGHFWGHVQVIKPPKLIEIAGPLFMSYPALNHLQYRLTAEGAGTRLKLTHRALGEVPAEHRDGVGKGWTYCLDLVRRIAEARHK